MDERDWLAERFEAHRTRMRAMAYRMLGSLSEADDAVQEAWLRLSRAEMSDVENLGGYLTTVVARVCLNMLHARTSRRQEPLGGHMPQPIVSRADALDPEHEALLADSVGLALLIVLDRLAPAERLAFVLHDIFEVPFAEIAKVVGRSSTAARQLASRARRVREAATSSVVDLRCQREVVEAFLAASRGGDFDALVALLDPDIVLQADRAAVRAGTSREVRGATAVAKQFSGRIHFAQKALVNGGVGLVWALSARPRAVFGFTIAGAKIVAIDLVGDPEHLRQLAAVLLVLGDRPGSHLVCGAGCPLSAAAEGAW